MDGVFDENFYFNNPSRLRVASNRLLVSTGISSPCEIHIATGSGPWENSGPSYRMSEMLRSRGIAHHLDDWGPEGGHEWPYWHHQMWEYVGAHY